MIMPTIDAFQEDLALPYRHSVEASFTPDWILWSLTALLATMAIILFSMLISTGAVWLARRFGGREYQLNLASAVSARAAATLTSHHVPIEHAIDVACGLVGDQPEVKSRFETLFERDKAEGAFETQQRIANLAGDSESRAADRLRVMRSVFPATMFIAIGGITVMLYALVLFGPLVAIIRSLGETGGS